MFSNQGQKSFTPIRGKPLTGFILLETIVAVFILTVGIIGLYALITQSAAETNRTSAKITANYLAQEGIEIARNIRDSNLLDKCYNTTPERGGGVIPWDEGLGDPFDFTSCNDVASYYEADYDTTELLGPSSGEPQFLKLDSASGFYNYDSGNPTQFQRKIFICDKQSVITNADWDPAEKSPLADRAESLITMVKIYWQSKEIASYQERLYNLYQVIKDVSPTGCVSPPPPGP